MGDQGELAAIWRRKCHSSVKIVVPGNRPLQPCFTVMTAASSRRSGAMDEREKLVSKLKRYATIRDRISDERAVAAIEQLIRETEERLRQTEDHAPDQKALKSNFGGGAQ